MKTKTLALPLALAAALCATSVEACIDLAPFEVEDIRQANVIFTGKILRYKRISPGRPTSLDDYGLFTIRVDKSIRGNASGDIQLYWWNSTFGVPEDRNIDTPVLIAAVSSKHPTWPVRVSATVLPTRRPDLMQVMQAPCAPPFILDATSENIISIEKLLRGEKVAPRDYFSIQRMATDRWQRAEAESKARQKTVLIAFGAALGLALTALIGVFVRKRFRPG